MSLLPYQTSNSDAFIHFLPSSSTEHDYDDTSDESYGLQLNTSSESSERNVVSNQVIQYRNNNVPVQYRIQEPKSKEDQVESVLEMKKIISQQRKAVLIYEAKYKSCKKQLTILSKRYERSKAFSLQTSFSSEKDVSIGSEMVEGIKPTAHICESSIEDVSCILSDDSQLSSTMEDLNVSKFDSSFLPLNVGVLKAETLIKAQELECKLSEIDELKSEIEVRSGEMKRLKSGFRAKCKYLARVELERDLIEAEAQRAKEDLSFCRSELFQIKREISEASGAMRGSKNEQRVVKEYSDKEFTARKTSQLEQFPINRRSANTCISSNFPDHIECAKIANFPVQSNYRSSTRQEEPMIQVNDALRGQNHQDILSFGSDLDLFSDTTPILEQEFDKELQSTYTSYDTTPFHNPFDEGFASYSGVGPTSVRSTQGSQHREARSMQNTIRDASPTEKSNTPTPEKDKQLVPDVEKRPKSQKNSKGRRLLFFGKRNSSKQYSPMPQDECRDDKQTKINRNAEKQQEAITSLQTEVDRLSARLRESHSTVDELRKRLTLVNRYYDNVVTSLKNNVAKLTTEKTQIEIEMINQLALLDREKRSVAKKLGAEINAKETKIKLLQQNLNEPPWCEKVHVNAANSLHAEDSNANKFMDFPS
mmetsp:Transcript_29125/g.44025  ORF Transcript_29125/g.44025 Transcript_29125/m.44025 type:complete len:649 (+) Transcript_29125:270-2216(+)